MKNKFIETIDTDIWEVETPDGWKDFDGIGKTINYRAYEVYTDRLKNIICADDHIFIDENGNEILCKNLIPNETRLSTKEGIETVTSIVDLDFEESMYDLLNVDGEIYWTNSIASHNSTAFVLYILYFILFNEEKNVAILANKAKQSRELLERLKKAFTQLPFWLQQGVETWNKSSIELENGCKVSANSTSSDSIRGESISLLIVDECVSGDSIIRIQDPEGNEKCIIIEELENILEDNENSDLKVLTPSGFKHFDGLRKVVKDESIFLKTKTTELICSLNHKIDTKEGYKYAFDLGLGDYILTKSGPEKINCFEISEEKITLYDLVNVDDFRNRFYANDIVVSNCAFIDSNMWSEFFNSVYPTISSAKTSKICLTSTANGMNHYYNIWNKSIKNMNEFHPTKVDWWEMDQYSLSEESFDLSNFEVKKVETGEIRYFEPEDLFDILEEKTTYKNIHWNENGEYLIRETENMQFIPFDGIIKRKNGLCKIYSDAWRKETVSNIGQRQFDQEYGNFFQSTSASLISGDHLEAMEFSRPIPLSETDIESDILDNYPGIVNSLKIYENPIPGNSYVFGVDPAKITNESSGDSLAVQILDTSEFPFREVGVLRIKNELHYLEVPLLLKILGNYYNQALIAIENNCQVGLSIVDTLIYELDYENVYSEKAGTNGFRTTTKSKKIGCLNLKMFIEKGLLELVDVDTVQELSTFVKHKTSFAAMSGYSDDLVMSLIHALFFINDPAYMEPEEMEKITKKKFDPIVKKQEKKDDLEEEEPFDFWSSDEIFTEESIF